MSPKRVSFSEDLVFISASKEVECHKGGLGISGSKRVSFAEILISDMPCLRGCLSACSHDSLNGKGKDVAFMSRKRVSFMEGTLPETSRSKTGLFACTDEMVQVLKEPLMKIQEGLVSTMSPKRVSFADNLVSEITNDGGYLRMYSPTSVSMEGKHGPSEQGKTRKRVSFSEGILVSEIPFDGGYLRMCSPTTVSLEGKHGPMDGNLFYSKKQRSGFNDIVNSNMLIKEVSGLVKEKGHTSPSLEKLGPVNVMDKDGPFVDTSDLLDSAVKEVGKDGMEATEEEAIIRNVLCPDYGDHRDDNLNGICTAIQQAIELDVFRLRVMRIAIWVFAYYDVLQMEELVEDPFWVVDAFGTHVKECSSGAKCVDNRGGFLLGNLNVQCRGLVCLNAAKSLATCVGYLGTPDGKPRRKLLLRIMGCEPGGCTCFMMLSVYSGSCLG